MSSHTCIEMLRTGRAASETRKRAPCSTIWLSMSSPPLAHTACCALRAHERITQVMATEVGGAGRRCAGYSGSTSGARKGALCAQGPAPHTLPSIPPGASKPDDATHTDCSLAGAKDSSCSRCISPGTEARQPRGRCEDCSWRGKGPG